MEIYRAVTALAALAQETRLRLFRLLITRGPEGLPAGEIARRLGVPANTLSFHLSHLAGAELIQSRRQGRHLCYAIRPEGVRQLLAFLSDDCCGGRPDLCGMPPREGTPPEAAASGQCGPQTGPGVGDEDPRR